MNNSTIHPPPGTWNARNLLTVHFDETSLRKWLYRQLGEGKSSLAVLQAALETSIPYHTHLSKNRYPPNGSPLDRRFGLQRYPQDYL